MIKIEPVPGSNKAGKNSWIDKTRQVMTCDTPKCTGRLEGNAGESESSLKTAAYNTGWKRNWRNSQDICPGCNEPGESAAEEKGESKSYEKAEDKKGK